MFSSLVYITGNANKAKQTAVYAPLPLQHKKIDLPEIQSMDVGEILEYKSKAAYAIVKEPVLVEDVSLTFSALGRLPGTLIRWFLEEIGNEKMCRILDSYEDRSAIAQVTYGLYDGETLKTFSGSAKGTIVHTPRGDEWGWNPIFQPEGYTKTWGEMTEKERSKTSMRRIALEKLEAYLRKK